MYFIYSIYYVDVEEVLFYCFEKELNEMGILLFIVFDNGWKYDVYMEEYFIDVIEVFDEKLIEGNLFFDFLIYIEYFCEKVDKKFVEEMFELIKDLIILKDGKRFGEIKELFIIIFK